MPHQSITSTLTINQAQNVLLFINQNATLVLILAVVFAVIFVYTMISFKEDLNYGCIEGSAHDFVTLTENELVITRCTKCPYDHKSLS